MIDYRSSSDLTRGTQCFVVYCDALRVFLGYVLMQNGKVIDYAYRQLKVHEKSGVCFEDMVSLLLWCSC